MEILLAVALCVAYALGFFMLRAGWEDVSHGVGARKWPVARARWQECVLEHRMGSGGSYFRVRVAYDYEVGGRQYQGSNVAVGYLGNGTREVHEALHQRLVGMRPFVVRYHPRRPEISTILPAENALVCGTLVVALVWLTATTAFTLMALTISGHATPLLMSLSKAVDVLMGR